MRFLALTCVAILGAQGPAWAQQGTIIGTAPNVFVASFIKTQLYREISFLDWMLVAMPLVVVLLVAAWCLLTRGVFRVGRKSLPETRPTVRAPFPYRTNCSTTAFRPDRFDVGRVAKGKSSG